MKYVKMNRWFLVMSAVITLFILSFIFGSLTYRYVRPDSSSKQGGVQLDYTVESTFYPLRIRNVAADVNNDKVQPTHRTGGISSYKDGVIGVKSQGELFSFSDNKLTIHGYVPINSGRDQLAKVFDASDPQQKKLVDRIVNVLDVDVYETLEGLKVYLSLTYWDHEKACRSLKVIASYLGKKESLDKLTDSSYWSDLFSLSDCFSFSNSRVSPFRSPNVGGVLKATDQGVVLGVGDFHLDGVNNATEVSTNRSHYLGTIVLIDPESGEASIVSSGHRDPRGISADAGGQIYEVEHGPQGGDEFNRVVTGNHYGWPFETYGTQYNENFWPHTTLPTQGDKFVKPMFAWQPSINPSNFLFIQEYFTHWQGDALIPTLTNKLVRMRIDDSRVQFVEEIDIGRAIRDITQTSAGQLVAWDGLNSLTFISIAEPSAAKAGAAYLENLPKLGRATLQGCSICHSLDSTISGDNAPTLRNIYNRKIAASDFSYYSGALKLKGGIWNEKSLRRFLKEPQDFAPGTIMPKQRLTDEQIDSVIDFFKDE